MLYRTRLITELHSRREEFVSFGQTLREEVREAAARLRALAAEGSAAVRERVEAAGYATEGRGTGGFTVRDPWNNALAIDAT